MWCDGEVCAGGAVGSRDCAGGQGEGLAVELNT